MYSTAFVATTTVLLPCIFPPPSWLRHCLPLPCVSAAFVAYSMLAVHSQEVQLGEGRSRSMHQHAGLSMRVSVASHGIRMPWRESSVFRCWVRRDTT